jgi:hypothetical protein
MKVLWILEKGGQPSLGINLLAPEFFLIIAHPVYKM